MGTVHGGCIGGGTHLISKRGGGLFEGVKLITAGEYGVVSTGTTGSAEKNLEMLASRRKVCRNLRHIVYVLQYCCVSKKGGGRYLQNKHPYTLVGPRAIDKLLAACVIGIGGNKQTLLLLT